MTEISYTIEEEDVAWLITWEGLKADGSRLYPNKPEREWIFESAEALAHLIINEVIFLNDNWWEETWPDAAKKTVALCVNCNDVFTWASADAQTILRSEIEVLYRLWKDEPIWGAAAWCIHKRKIPPQNLVLNEMKKLNHDIDWLMSCTDEDILQKHRRTILTSEITSDEKPE